MSLPDRKLQLRLKQCTWTRFSHRSLFSQPRPVRQRVKPRARKGFQHYECRAKTSVRINSGKLVNGELIVTSNDAQLAAIMTCRIVLPEKVILSMGLLPSCASSQSHPCLVRTTGSCSLQSILYPFFSANEAMRIKVLEITNFRNYNVNRIFTILIYLWTIHFTGYTNFLLSGSDLITERSCRTPEQSCLMFYIGNKALLYLFSRREDSSATRNNSTM